MKSEGNTNKSVMMFYVKINTFIFNYQALVQ